MEACKANDFYDLLSRTGDDRSDAFQLKKDLYTYLCDHPVLIDAGRKSFSLDKESGKKSFMLSARDLSIAWGDNPEYWKWRSFSKSRFSEVAELLDVCWLDIHGKISTAMLSPGTNYAVYLVYKTRSGMYGFDGVAAEGSTVMSGEESEKRKIFLNFEGAQSEEEDEENVVEGGLGDEEGEENVEGSQIDEEEDVENVEEEDIENVEEEEENVDGFQSDKEETENDEEYMENVEEEAIDNEEDVEGSQSQMKEENGENVEEDIENVVEVQSEEEEQENVEEPIAVEENLEEVQNEEEDIENVEGVQSDVEEDRENVEDPFAIEETVEEVQNEEEDRETVEEPFAIEETVEEVENEEEEMGVGYYPRKREDGWLEVELGEYFVSGEEDGKDLEMALREVRVRNWKGGIIVEGIQIRPKPIFNEEMEAISNAPSHKQKTLTSSNLFLHFLILFCSLFLFLFFWQFAI